MAIEKPRDPLRIHGASGCANMPSPAIQDGMLRGDVRERFGVRRMVQAYYGQPLK